MVKHSECYARLADGGFGWREHFENPMVVPKQDYWMVLT